MLWIQGNRILFQQVLEQIVWGSIWPVPQGKRKVAGQWRTCTVLRSLVRVQAERTSLASMVAGIHV